MPLKLDFESDVEIDGGRRAIVHSFSLSHTLNQAAVLLLCTEDHDVGKMRTRRAFVPSSYLQTQPAGGMLYLALAGTACARSHCQFAMVG